MITIYKQLEPLQPKEIEFLSTSVAAKIDNSINIVEQQKAVLKQLQEALSRYQDKFEDQTFHYAKDNIPKYEEAIKANMEKIELMKSISDKLKQFEGII